MDKTHDKYGVSGNKDFHTTRKTNEVEGVRRNRGCSQYR